MRVCHCVHHLADASSIPGVVITGDTISASPLTLPSVASTSPPNTSASTAVPSSAKRAPPKRAASMDHGPKKIHLSSTQVHKVHQNKKWIEDKEKQAFKKATLMYKNELGKPEGGGDDLGTVP